MELSLHQTRYRVEGMDCAGCAMKIDTAVRRLPAVEDVMVSVATGTLTVSHRGDAALAPDITKQVTGLGYRIVPLVEDGSCGPGEDNGAHGQADHEQNENVSANHNQSSSTSGPRWLSGKGRLTMASGMALAVAWGLGEVVPDLKAWIFTAALLVGLVPIAWRAVKAALAGTPFSIEMLMAIAAIGAVIIGAGEEATAVVFLFLIGELLEGIAAGKARAGIQSLADLVPKTAFLEEDGKTREVLAESLTVGAAILVRPGDRIPADGVILSGESAIDEAPVTGESVPVRKGMDATVFAGTINGDAALRIRVTSAAVDNTIARVVRLVEEAQESKAPTERFIDRFSRFYTPGVVVVGTLVATVPPLLLGGAWGEWVYKGLAILLIGCPCALVISTPAAIAASLSTGARRGLLFKGGAVLETIGKITAVAFDKTGTLTEGKPKVTDIFGCGTTKTEVLRLAAALETGSNHPFARAILDQAAVDRIEVPKIIDARAIGGKGVIGTLDDREVFLGSPQAARERAQFGADLSMRIAAFNDEGKTVSVLVIDKMIIGVLAMRDEPRADAEASLKVLSDAGIRTVMLTGDNRRTALAIGNQLGIEVMAELLPQDKQLIVDELKRQGFLVAKVGDGINDAPALAAADVGIAMGGGTDVALETADAAVLHGRVGDVASMIALSKRTMANIHQNIAVALGLKGVFLITTIVGITGLWPAILADTGATVLVTLNALRLLTQDRW